MSYALKYDFSIEMKDEGEWEKEELGDYGGADALFLVSIIRDGKGAHKGATSHAFVSHDGHNKGQPIPFTEQFSVWASLACYLSEHDLPEWQKEIVNKTIEMVRHEIVEKGRGMGSLN